MTLLNIRIIFIKPIINFLKSKKDLENCSSGMGQALMAFRLIYKTSFVNTSSEIFLRSDPDVNLRAIYKCPSQTLVYVIDKGNEYYYYVWVSGHTGYVSKSQLFSK